jgi:peptide/nickel transport system permease protein
MHIDVWGGVLESRASQAGAILLGLVILMAALAPVLAPYSPKEMGPVFLPPSEEHLLGTDDLGQDIASKLIFGARTSLAVACGVVLLSSLLSIVIGGSSALIGGLYDRIWMRVVDTLLAIPATVVMILVAAYLRPSLLTMIVMISLLSWPDGARIIRSQTLSLRERLHVSAARTFGAGTSYILFRHVVPELGPIIIAVMIQDAMKAVFMEAGLAFLGVSDSTVVSWGVMMHQALRFTYLDVWRWWLVPTGLALSITLVGLSLIGAGLETAMDPRLQQEESS